MGPREALLSSVIPLVVSLLVLGGVYLVLPRVLRRKAMKSHAKKSVSGDGAFWLVPLLMAGAVTLGSYVWQTRVELWPEAVTHRFPAIALAMIACAVPGLLGNVKLRLVAAGIFAFVLGGFGVWAFLSELHESLISEPARITWIVVGAVVASAGAALLEASGDRLRGWRGPLLLSGILGTIGLGATQGFANAPMIFGAAGSVLGAAFVLGVFYPRANLLRGAGASGAVLIVSGVAFANWFGDTERWTMLAILWASPLLTGVIFLPKLRGLKPTPRLFIAGLLAIGSAGVQAAIALPPLIRSMQASPDEYYYDYE